MSNTPSVQISNLLGTRRKKNRRSAQEILAAREKDLRKAQRRLLEQSIKDDPRAKELFDKRGSLRAQISQIRAMVKLEPSNPNNIENRISRAQTKLDRLILIRDNHQEAERQLKVSIEQVEQQMAELSSSLMSQLSELDDDSDGDEVDEVEDDSDGF